MSRYGIPKEITGGFRLLIKLDMSTLKTLYAIIENSKVGQGIESIAEESSDKLPNLNIDDFKLIISALFSLVNIFVESKDSIDKFALEFSDSYKSAYPNVSEDDLEKLKNHLIVLLPSISSIRLTMKARELLLQNPNNFADARIITDIRIVFNDENLLDRNRFALIVHQLNFNCFSSYNEKNLVSLSLDNSDLKKLKKIIDRALDKENSIRNSTLDLQFIDLN